MKGGNQLRAYNVSVSRPETEEIRARERRGEYVRMWRDALVITDGLDDAVSKAIDYYNDIDGVDDYYFNNISVSASTDEGEGCILLM
jgi:hypothetical protein